MNYDNIEILLAEDNNYDADLTLRALKKGGLTNEIYRVSDGAEALDFIFFRGDYAARTTNEKLKLILLDLKMPKISGLRVLEKVKSDPLTRQLNIVVLTSSREDPDITKCYGFGANSYIVKPVENDDFFRALREIGLYWMILNQPMI